VEIRCGARVTGIEASQPRVEALRLGSERLEADLFILATGGASYPETGTRGEVLGWLRDLKVPVSPWFPALAPIPLQRARLQWEGVALREGELVVLAGAGGRRLARFKGDILFTKTGITGPAALELSRPAEEARRAGASFLTYASTTKTPEQVDAETQAEQRSNPQLKAAHWLQRWLPERLCEALVVEAGMDADQRMKDLGREARRALVGCITAFPLGEPRAVSLERGEVAAGGVELAAVDPHTMAVKGWTNLRICGELLDVDGPVGGYNLQAAFSTGFVAGDIP
jgi:predicted Rossmann fold flavoprotein